jgi:hypothetical protein
LEERSTSHHHNAREDLAVAMGYFPHARLDESSLGEQAGVIKEIEWGVSGRLLALARRRFCARPGGWGDRRRTVPDILNRMVSSSYKRCDCSTARNNQCEGRQPGILVFGRETFLQWRGSTRRNSSLVAAH